MNERYVVYKVGDEFTIEYFRDGSLVNSMRAIPRDYFPALCHDFRKSVPDGQIVIRHRSSQETREISVLLVKEGINRPRQERQLVPVP